MTPTSTHWRMSLLAGAALAYQMLGCAVAHGASKSISSFVSCSGSGDETGGVAKAFAAARNSAFTLVVDCPVHLHSGLAVDRGIFIDNGTSVEFTGNGKFFVDNVFHPAFIIANSTNVNLTNWNVEWDGAMPLDGSTGGYEIGGKFISAPAGTRTQPAGAFNDLVLTKWLAANRAVNFDPTQGWVKSIWVGGVNPAAVFFITGDTSNVTFKGLRLYSSPTAGGEGFIPMAISFSANWKSNQTVSGKTPRNPQYVGVPHELTFSDITYDGTLMGWQGNVRDATFDHIKSHRYGDMQDANNGNSGGIGKWFPPPHLFYLNYTFDGDPGLFNANIRISNVVDDGPRVGVARDKGGGDTMSGYANSLKLGCTNCSVDNYTTNRPDGFMDVLQSDGLTINNVTSTYDSSFLNDVFQGLRFPMKGYRHLTFQNLTLTDTSAVTKKVPISNASDPSNDGIVFKNVHVVMNNWAGGGELPLPVIAGTSNDVSIEYTITGQKIKALYLAQGAATVALKVAPYTVAANSTVQLAWTSKGADSCSTGGAWPGPLTGNASKDVKVGPSGNYDFTVNCLGGPAESTLAVTTAASATTSATAGLRVVVR